MRPYHLVAALILATAPAMADALAAVEGPITVVDGDTVDAGGRRWRLDGLDAPEIATARCATERERGIKTAARLIALIAERGARIVPVPIQRGDKVASGGFGRSLGRLEFRDGTSWLDVGTAERHVIAWKFGTKRPGWCRVPSA